MSEGLLTGARTWAELHHQRAPLQPRAAALAVSAEFAGSNHFSADGLARLPQAAVIDSFLYG